MAAVKFKEYSLWCIYDLTKEIAEKSIYDYLENTLGVSIVTSKRIMTV